VVDIFNAKIYGEQNCKTITVEKYKKLSYADKPRDAFRGQSSSSNMVPFDM